MGSANDAEVRCRCGALIQDSQPEPLTPEEQQAYRDRGLEVPSQGLSYCKPCSKVLKHPVYGPRLLEGLFIRMAVANGVPLVKAWQTGERYHKVLCDLQQKLPPP